jgi:hypothetical protein
MWLRDAEAMVHCWQEKHGKARAQGGPMHVGRCLHLFFVVITECHRLGNLQRIEEVYLVHGSGDWEV